MTKTVPVITIDGPSGSGKGTVARLLADKLGYHLLDSGALYRLLALYLQQTGTSLEDTCRVAELARELPVHFRKDGTPELNGVVVGDELRTEETGALASQVAAIPEVREALLARQRAFRQSPGLVADGRDMGTVVFPDASCKFFLTASAEERARRRWNQLKEKGLNASLPALLEDIKARDKRDSERAVAPLKPAPDAIQVDSTSLSINEVLALMLSELSGQG